MPRHRMLVLLLTAATSACACFVPGPGSSGLDGTDRDAWLAAAQTSQRAVVHWRDGVETLIVDVGYRGDGGPVAWLVPVPVDPLERGLFPVSHWYLATLFRQTTWRRWRGLTDAQPLPFASHPLAALEPWAFLPWSWGRTRDSAVGRAVDSPLLPEALERRQVDAFDAAVLRVADADELIAWLRQSGFVAPDGLREASSDYLARGWRFVALRAQNPRAGEGLAELRLNAMAIRFPAAQPVYPMGLSRLSSPKRQVVDILTMTPGPVTCHELPIVPPTAFEDRPQSLDQARRELCDEAGWRALVQLQHAVPYQRFHSPNRSEDIIGDHETTRLRGLCYDGLVVSRFWGLLDRDAMVDLTFVPATESEPQALAENGGATYRPQRQWLWTASWLPVVVCWLVTAWLLGALVDRPAPREQRLWEALAAVALSGLLAILLSGLMTYAHCQRRLPVWGLVPMALAALPLALLRSPAEARERAMAARLALAAGALAPMGLLLTVWQRNPVFRQPDHTLSFLANWLVGQPGWQRVDWLVPLSSVVCWLATIAMIAVAGRTVPRLRGAPWSMSLIGGLCAAVAVGVVMTRLAAEPARGRAGEAIYERSEILRDGVDRFVAEFGCYPSAFQDLARPGTVGLDASGNQVELTGDWHGPYLRKRERYRLYRLTPPPVLHELPVDPTTGSRDTWRYDPTADVIVDGGGWGWDVRVVRF